MIHVAGDPDYRGRSLTDGTEIRWINGAATVSFPESHIDLYIMAAAKNAVYKDSGRSPTTFIVGLWTYFELTVHFWEKMQLFESWFGKFTVDTTREHYFAAGADPQWQVGRVLPRHSVWQWTEKEGWRGNE